MIDQDTRFDLASLTKPLLTTAAWLRAWERGLDALDAELVPGATVEDTLRHRAGFKAHTRLDRSLGQVRPGTRAAYRRAVELAAQAPRGAPGPTVYSDLGFILLGARVERLYGASLAALIPMFTPELSAPPMRADAAAASRGGEPGGWVHDDNARAMGGVAGHAGLFGAALGVDAIVWRMMCGPRSLREAAWGPPMTARGLGWDRATPGPLGTVPGWPSDTVGHLGYTGTSVWLVPSRGWSVTLLTNRTYFSEGPEPIRALRRAFHEAAHQVLLRS